MEYKFKEDLVNKFINGEIHINNPFRLEKNRKIIKALFKTDPLNFTVSGDTEYYKIVKFSHGYDWTCSSYSFDDTTPVVHITEMVESEDTNTNSIIDNIEVNDFFHCEFDKTQKFGTSSGSLGYIRRDSSAKVYCKTYWKVYEVNNDFISFEEPDYSYKNYYIISKRDLLKYKKLKVIKTNKENENQTKEINNNVMKKTITGTELLEIYSIACTPWKQHIKKYFDRLDNTNNITFSTEEIEKIINACTKEQLPIVSKIFNYNKITDEQLSNLQIGDKVYLKYSGKHCNSCNDINYDEPFYLIMKEKNKFINSKGFRITNANYTYYSFIQDNKFVVYGVLDSESKIDFITQIIK